MAFKWMPFLVNFNRKRRSIILKKSKGRRNPIVNFIYFFLLSFIEIYKKLHICNVYILMSLEIHKHLSAASTTAKKLHNAPHLQRSRMFPWVPCSFVGALFLTLRSTLS